MMKNVIRINNKLVNKLIVIKNGKNFSRQCLQSHEKKMCIKIMTKVPRTTKTLSFPRKAQESSLEFHCYPSTYKEEAYHLQ